MIAALAHNLGRWTTMIGLPDDSPTHRKTRRRRLFVIPGRLTRTARKWTLRLPARWPWEEQFTGTGTHPRAPRARLNTPAHTEHHAAPRPAAPADSGCLKTTLRAHPTLRYRPSTATSTRPSGLHPIRVVNPPITPSTRLYGGFRLKGLRLSPTNIRVITLDGELIHELTLDPARLPATPRA